MQVSIEMIRCSNSLGEIMIQGHGTKHFWAKINFAKRHVINYLHNEELSDLYSLTE